VDAIAIEVDAKRGSSCPMTSATNESNSAMWIIMNSKTREFLVETEIAIELEELK
jgi:hypothetical protein